MSDLSERLRGEIASIRADYPREQETLHELAQAVDAVLELAENLRGDGDSPHACGGRGEPDCALCVAQDMEHVMARELGTTEEVTR